MHDPYLYTDTNTLGNNNPPEGGMDRRLLPLTKDEIDKSLEYVNGTMAYEDMELPDDTLKIYKKYLKGKITEGQTRDLLIKKNLSKEV